MIYNKIFDFFYHFWMLMKMVQVHTLNTYGTFYQYGLTSIPAWISNHMPSKVWDEITDTFLNFNGFEV